jgi:large subunit ribosomal protein L32
MPVPKRRKSQSRSRMQRAANMRISYASLPMSCPDCGEPKPSHRICPSCGKYDGKQIVPVVEK